jgi:predicted dehydrogenase
VIVISPAAKPLRRQLQDIAGWDWNPGHVCGEIAAWGSSNAFDGEACALLVMRMTNGSFASCEGNNLETGKTNSWYGEYYHLECERGATVRDRDHIVRIEERSAAGTLQMREVPPLDVIWEGHQAVAAQFLDWLDGGPPPATTLADNLQSTAMLFAAIRASETGMTVDVQEMARELAGE